MPSLPIMPPFTEEHYVTYKEDISILAKQDIIILAGHVGFTLADSLLIADLLIRSRPFNVRQ